MSLWWCNITSHSYSSITHNTPTSHSTITHNNSNGTRVTDEDIDIILEKSTKKTEETMAKFRTDVQHNLGNFKLTTENSRTPSYVLDGDASEGLLMDLDETSGTFGQFIPLGQRQRGGLFMMLFIILFHLTHSTHRPCQLRCQCCIQRHGCCQQGRCRQSTCKD